MHMTNIKKPSVNIVIPVYNEEKELSQSVDTLVEYFRVHLTDFVWHISIADNASTDTTLDVANKLAHTYPQVSAIHILQKGRGRAVKYVWQNDSSDIVAYMDVD